MMFFFCGTLPRHNLLILLDVHKGHDWKMSFMQRRSVQ